MRCRGLRWAATRRRPVRTGSPAPLPAPARSRPAARTARRAASQRPQLLHQVALLPATQVEVPGALVMLDHIVERLGAAVVEVGRVLPQRPERRGAVLPGR